MVRTFLGGTVIAGAALAMMGCAKPDITSHMMKIDERVATGGQPVESDFQALKAKGYTTVVNLREPNEKDPPAGLANEAELVRAAGLEYVSIPVNMKKMTDEQVALFRAELAKRDGPVFVHCRTGHRAGAFAMMRKACDSGWTGQQTLDEAHKMGFRCDDRPELRDFVKGYVDRHGKQN